MSRKDTADRPLLFVNSDPSEGGTVPHRRAIYQHVQLKYAKWKRGEKQQNRRSSASMPNIQHEESLRRRVSLVSPPSLDTFKSQSSTEDAATSCRSKPNIGKSRPRFRYTPPPVSIIHGGNSDPFSALAVPVTPNTNALMEYTRDYYLPGIQRDVNNPGQKLVGPEWAQCVSFLQDEGLAYAHFARMAALLASDPKQSDLAGDFYAQALLFKSKGMTLLHAKLIADAGNPKTYHQILLLMNAEIFDRNFLAATAHAKMLAQLLQEDIIKDDILFAFKVVYHDTQRAAMSLTRPVLDLDGWVTDQLIPVDILIPRKHPSLIWFGPMGLDLDPSMDYNPSLKQTLGLFKQNCLALIVVFHDKAYLDRKQLFYGRFYMSLIMGHFVNHYIDAIEALDTRNNNWMAESQPFDETRTSAAMSLAMLLLLRCMTQIDDVKISGNIRIFRANMLIMHRLKEILMSTNSHNKFESRTDFSNARLYVLFIGAWLEQVRAAAQRAATGLPADLQDAGNLEGKSGAELGWFNCELAEHARAMGLTEWMEVREILQRFIYVDIMKPDAAFWFPWIVRNCTSHAF